MAVHSLDCCLPETEGDARPWQYTVWTAWTVNWKRDNFIMSHKGGSDEPLELPLVVHPGTLEPCAKTAMPAVTSMATVVDKDRGPGPGLFPSNLRRIHTVECSIEISRSFYKHITGDVGRTALYCQDGRVTMSSISPWLRTLRDNTSPVFDGCR